MDPRYNDLASVLVSHSVGVKRGDNVLIHAIDVPDDIAIALIRAVRAKGGNPFVELQHNRVSREFMMGMKNAQAETWRDIDLNRMQAMDGYIALRGSNNIFEMSDVPAKDLKSITGIYRAVQNWRVNKTRWVVLRWPSTGMAQQALTSTTAFEDFYFRVCTMDYAKMARATKPLQKLMAATDQVHIKGPGTDLRFSIKGIDAIPCSGSRNIPDGECFSCPVRDSVEGEITYNCPTVYQGSSFDNVHFEFSKGKIVKASCTGDAKKFNSILNSDEGARYIGEFAIGFNPHILEPMRDTLFDEKIAGSFHFTPGQCYEDTSNGNNSQIHWDIVNIQRPEYGGGEIWFDGKLVRKDGLFVPKSLQGLNPENLVG